MNEKRRLLVANHIDRALLPQKDQRTIVQRILWLVQEGDVIIVPSEPDRSFLEHVCEFLNLRKSSLKFIILNDNQTNGRLLDPLSVLSPRVINELAPFAEEFKEILCLWPSPQVSELASVLGIERAMPGAFFFSQGGDALVNSKATFRALAAASEIPIPNGRVCRSENELKFIINKLLSTSDGVMIKQCHNGAAAGCTIIHKSARTLRKRAGSIWINDISELNDSLHNLWRWASVEERFPVIVEEHIDVRKTVWFEFNATDSELFYLAAGELEYENGNLIREHTPLDLQNADFEYQLGLNNARLICEYYRAAGYRGQLSADGVVNPMGNILYTEVNARIGGSLPIYGGIWKRIVKRSEEIDRHIVQYLTPSNWNNLETSIVLQRLTEAGLLYDPNTRTGTLLGIPPHMEIQGGMFLLCIVSRTSSDQSDFLNLIENVLQSK